MRQAAWILSAGVLLFLNLPARAQGLSGSFLQPGQAIPTFGSSGASQVIQNVPINTNLSVAPFPGQSQPGYLLSFFHQLQLPLFGQSPTIGVSPLPAPSSFPSTNYPNKLPQVPIPPPQTVTRN